jgi:hypothetical protein
MCARFDPGIHLDMVRNITKTHTEQVGVSDKVPDFYPVVLGSNISLDHGYRE